MLSIHDYCDYALAIATYVYSVCYIAVGSVIIGTIFGLADCTVDGPFIQYYTETARMFSESEIIAYLDEMFKPHILIFVLEYILFGNYSSASTVGINSLVRDFCGVELV